MALAKLPAAAAAALLLVAACDSQEAGWVPPASTVSIARVATTRPAVTVTTTHPDYDVLIAGCGVGPRYVDQVESVGASGSVHNRSAVASTYWITVRFFVRDQPIGDGYGVAHRVPAGQISSWTAPPMTPTGGAPLTDVTCELAGALRQDALT
jgi:hypothetical protein